MKNKRIARLQSRRTLNKSLLSTKASSWTWGLWMIMLGLCCGTSVPRDGSAQEETVGSVLDPFPKEVSVDPMLERKSRYRHAGLNAGHRRSALLRQGGRHSATIFNICVYSGCRRGSQPADAEQVVGYACHAWCRALGEIGEDGSFVLSSEGERIATERREADAGMR